MSTLAERLEEIIQENHWSKRELARKAHLRAETHAAAMFKPGYDPRLSTIVALADAAKVTVQWLATGEGPKRRDDAAVEEALRRVARQIVDSERKSTIRPVAPEKK